MCNEKIKLESHGISPWHYFLENMSWGFSRKQSDEDLMAYLNVDPNLKNGGRGLEDVLVADFLQNLDFADRSFLGHILKFAHGTIKLEPENAEIRGNAGNYYIPYEDEEHGIRLVQPDGWIADEKNLILLEAKGYRKTASLNKGQLAKEFLIAQSVARKTGRENFYVMLIVNNIENIYKSGKENFNLSAKSFSALWRKNVADLEEFLQGKKAILREDKFPADSDNPIIAWDDFAKLNADDVQSHFLWITWERICEISTYFNDRLSKSGDDSQKNPYAQIAKTIHFHSTQNINVEMPIFSQMLKQLAADKEPLYRFYNGGCGHKTLQKYENDFLTAIGKSVESNPWLEWHKLFQTSADEFMQLSILEERRRIAISLLRQTTKDIQQFYKDNLNEYGTSKTTRRAFDILGESANLESNSNEKHETSKWFGQRMKIKKKKEKI